MPRGSGIYEDEPRDHRHTYAPGSRDDPSGPEDDPAPDDSASKHAEEPTA